MGEDSESLELPTHSKKCKLFISKSPLRHDFSMLASIDNRDTLLSQASYVIRKG